MYVLKEKIKELLKTTSIPSFFKDNSMRFMKLYQSPDNDNVKAVNMAKIQKGGIYFMLYQDESNWMQYSPILCCDFRDNRLVFGINLNFIPLEIRLELFDNIINDLEENNNQPNGTTPFNYITFEKAYKMLLRYGYEYAIVEYEISRIAQVYDIKYEELPYWIYSQYPTLKYDPIKLYQIWESKLAKRPERHKEMIAKLVKDFYNVTDELIENSDALKGHLQRLKRNYDKFGDKFS